MSDTCFELDKAECGGGNFFTFVYVVHAIFVSLLIQVIEMECLVQELGQCGFHDLSLTFRRREWNLF